VFNQLWLSQAQKELLDAELDLYQKTQAGEDTALLKMKYTQLQIEVRKEKTVFQAWKEVWGGKQSPYSSHLGALLLS